MIRFVISEAIKNFFRAKFSGFITILSMIFALFLVALISISAANGQRYLYQLKRQTPITIFFPKSMKENDAESYAKKIEQFELVKSIRFISSTDGLKEYNRTFNTDVNKLLGKNPLPHAAEIKLAKSNVGLSDFAELKKKIRTLNPNIEVEYNQGLVRKLERYIGYLAQAGIALTGIIIIICIILIINTIRLSIHDKRLIIRTMRLVGAKDRHIKSPFILEAMIQAGVAFSVVYGFIKYSEFYLKAEFSYRLGYLPYQHHGLLALAFLMAIFGSWLSVRKYLKWNFK